jgi:hypothetical protein
MPAAPRGPTQPAPNALLAQEKALASDTLSADPSIATRATAANFARDGRDIAKRVVVFMLNSFSIVIIANLPLGLTARGRQMIQPAIENKYWLDMLVSARAMDSQAHSLHASNSAPRNIRPMDCVGGRKLGTLLTET